jgi:hypothetical protein
VQPAATLDEIPSPPHGCAAPAQRDPQQHQSKLRPLPLGRSALDKENPHSSIYRSTLPAD